MREGMRNIFYFLLGVGGLGNVQAYSNLMNHCCCQVSATFAASLVTSPALGSYLEQAYSENLVVWLATAVALLDIFFILVAVPESLPEKLRPASWGSQISWDKADPFGVRIINVQSHTW